MIANLYRIDAPHENARAAAGLHERCPFLQQAVEAHAPLQPRLRPPESRWPADVVEADARVNEVLSTFERTGGVASADEVMRMLRRRTSQPDRMLARWISDQRVVSFARRGEYLLPMFQFERADMCPRPAVTAVLDELDRTFVDWELATWFALPNGWLDDEAPVDVLDRAPDAVRQAARADRFIARG